MKKHNPWAQPPQPKLDHAPWWNLLLTPLWYAAWFAVLVLVVPVGLLLRAVFA